MSPDTAGRARPEGLGGSGRGLTGSCRAPTNASRRDERHPPPAAHHTEDRSRGVRAWGEAERARLACVVRTRARGKATMSRSMAAEVIEYSGTTVRRNPVGGHAVEKHDFLLAVRVVVSVRIARAQSRVPEPPHFHRPFRRQIDDLQQMFVVQRGVVVVELFADEARSSARSSSRRRCDRAHSRRACDPRHRGLPGVERQTGALLRGRGGSGPLRAGLMGRVPPDLAVELRDQLGLRRAVETGTYSGEGARVLAGLFDSAITIELSQGTLGAGRPLTGGPPQPRAPPWRFQRRTAARRRSRDAHAVLPRWPLERRSDRRRGARVPGTCRARRDCKR